MVDIISTTKDNPDDATNAPNTASVIEQEDNKVVVEHKYIIRAKDDTIDNDEVRDEVVDKIQTQFRLEMFFEPLVEKEWLNSRLTPVFIPFFSDISSKATILFIIFISFLFVSWSEIF